MFISIDHIPDMELYTHKQNPTKPIVLNLSHIVTMTPMNIYPNGISTEITKIILVDNGCVYLPFPWDESMAMLRHSAKLSDFRVAMGDYYVEIRKYISPADIDKAQLETLAKYTPSL